MDSLDENELNLVTGGESSEALEMWEVLCNNCKTIVNCSSDRSAASRDKRLLNQSNFACLNCGQSGSWIIRSVRGETYD